MARSREDKLKHDISMARYIDKRTREGLVQCKVWVPAKDRAALVAYAEKLREIHKAK